MVYPFGNGFELTDFIILTVKRLHYTNATDIFLHHIVKRIIGLENMIENWVYLTDNQI